MNVSSLVIVGLDHWLQNWRPAAESNAEARNGLRRNYANELLCLMSGLPVGTMLEETDHQRTSISSEICESLGWGYQNFDFTPLERRAVSMPLDCDLQDDYRVNVLGKPALSEPEQLAIRGRRDELLSERLRGRLATTGGSVIIVGGVNHLASFVSVGAEFCSNVALIDFTAMPWFDPRLF